MTDDWLAYLHAHRRTTKESLVVAPLAQRCPLLLMNSQCSQPCTYDLTNRRGIIDGRCHTKAAALGRPIESPRR